MFYEYLANIVMVVHVFLILCLLFSILVSARFKKFRPLESGILLLVIVIWSLYEGCPLTYLENTLRVAASHPLPIGEMGFIPYYLYAWLGLSITNQELVLTTYITAFLFFLVSIEWISPYVNVEFIRIRKFLVSKNN